MEVQSSKGDFNQETKNSTNSENLHGFFRFNSLNFDLVAKSPFEKGGRGD